MEDKKIRQKVEQLKSDLRQVTPEAGAGNLTTDGILLLRTATWARSEDPRRLADLTGVPLDEVHELAEGFQRIGVWPLSYVGKEDLH